MFARETLYAGHVISLPGTGGSTVRILSSDFIEVRAVMTVDVRIGDTASE